VRKKGDGPSRKKKANRLFAEDIKVKGSGTNRTQGARNRKGVAKGLAGPVIIIGIVGGYGQGGGTCHGKKREIGKV